MRILYIASARIPTEKAHGIQIMQMCSAFSALGHTLTLVVPRRHNFITDSPFIYYAVPKNFTIQYLPAMDTVSLGALGFFVHRASFAFSVWCYTRTHKADLVYGRDELALLCAQSTAPKIWEAHEGRWNAVLQKLLMKVSVVVVISKGLRDFFTQKGIAASSILIAPDGVNLQAFARPLTKEEARARLGFSHLEKIVLYTGHLYAWKGVDTLARAAALLPDITFVFLGGTQSDQQKFRAAYGATKNIRILPPVRHAIVPTYLYAADVLALPNTATESLSSLYTSPLKLFEYMASGRPIVASDLPSLREVLTEDSAFFAVADDAADFARAIESVFQNEAESTSRARSAREHVALYTWEKRAQSILAVCPLS